MESGALVAATVAVAEAPIAAKQTSARASVLSVIMRIFPYVGLEYVLFLVCIENAPSYAVAAGIAAAIAGLALASARIVAFPLPRLVAQGTAALTTLLGDPLRVGMSLVFLGVGWISWTGWNTSGIVVLSWLSVLLLLAAMFMLFEAAWRHTRAQAVS